MPKKPLVSCFALTEKRKHIMIQFVEAAYHLIQTNGIDGLSIRKISAAAGYQSASLYQYFRNLEYLTLFGSVRFLRGYVMSLPGALFPEMNATARFQTIYDCFNEHAFRHPDVFYTLFFSRSSKSLDEVLSVYYYELFPDELAGIDPALRRMLICGNMMERDRILMQDLVTEGAASPAKVEVSLQLISSLLQSMLYSAQLQGETLDIAAHKRLFRECFDHLLSAAG